MTNSQSVEQDGVVARNIFAMLNNANHGVGNGKGCPVVVHYCADLQSVYGFHCYDNIAPNAKCQRVLVLPLCLVALV